MIPPPNRPAGRATLPWVYFLSFALALCAPLARADNYGFIYADGNDFNAPDWFDSSTNPNMSNVGPPGPGDNATIGSGTVTCSGGAVESLSLLSGSNLQLSGTFTANTLADAGILSGNGTLTTQTLVGSFDIEGTNVVVGTSDAGGALNGGSLSINSYSGTSILAADGATLTIGNSLTDFNAGAATGASVTIPGIANGMDIPINCTGAGSVMDIANDVSGKASSLNVNDGGTLKVGGDLLLDGGTDFDGDPIGGGAGIDGAGTLVSVGGTLTVGYSAAEPGFTCSSTIKAPPGPIPPLSLTVVCREGRAAKG